MDETKIENIKKLINTVTIFSPTERAEWLELLPLMNDKQVFELERILASNQSQPVVVPPAAPKPLSNPGGIGVPGMSHIANLPHPLAVHPAKTIPPVPTRTIKEIVEEKELTTPKPFYQTELTPPAAKKETVSIKREPTLATSSLKNFPRPTPPPVQAAQPSWKAASGTITVETIKKKTPTPIVPLTGETKTPLVAPARVAKASLEVNPQDFHVGSLEDVKGLTPELFRSMPVATLIQLLQQLILENDYFQVKFALEGSKLYQTYLDIGRKLLDQRKDFSGIQAELQASGRPYLTQLEFENFTDLLSQIQINT